MNKFDKQFWVTYSIPAGLILIHVIPFIYPESRTWGFNHLIFLPDYFTYLFFILSGVALILPFLPFSEKPGELLVGRFSKLFYISPRFNIYRIAFVVLMTVLFIIFSAPTHFLGDGYDVIYNLASQTGIHIKWTEIGVTQLMLTLQSLLVGTGEATSERVFQIVSIISGFITILFFFNTAGILTENSIKKYLIFTGSLFSGVLLLFFGYAEYYPILWVFFAGNIYFTTKYIRIGKGLLPSWLFLLIGIILHIQMVILAAGTIYATFAVGRGHKIYIRFKYIILALAAIIGIGLAVAFYNKYTGDLYFEDIFLPLFAGKPIDTAYAIFSLNHLLDILNLLLLLSPIIFVFLFCIKKNMKTVLRDKLSLGLGLAAISCLGFLFVIDPKLGMPRDWDLFSFSFYPLVLLMILLLSDKGLSSNLRIIPALSIILFINIVPFWAVNLNESASVRYCEFITNLDINKSLSTTVVLQDYYDHHGDKNKVDSLKRIYDERYNGVHLYNRAMTAMDEGNLSAALLIIQSLDPNRFDGDYLRVWGRYYYLSGNYVKALEYLNKAVQLRRYNSMYYWQRAMIYFSLYQNDKALEDFRSAYNLDNLSLRVLDGMSYLYYISGKIDSTVYYAEKMIQLDSTQLGGYYLLAKAYYKLKDINAAGRYAGYFIQKTEGNASYTGQRNELMDLFKIKTDSIITP